MQVPLLNEVLFLIPFDRLQTQSSSAHCVQLLFILGAHNLRSSHTGHVPTMSLIVLIPQPGWPDCTPSPSLPCSFSGKQVQGGWGTHRAWSSSMELPWSASLCYEQKLCLNQPHSWNFSWENHSEALVSSLTCQ